MGSYQMNINASVTGQQSQEALVGSTDKLTARTKLLNDSLYGAGVAGDKMSIAMARMATEEAKLESLREKHRMSTEGLTASTLKAAAAQDVMAQGTGRMVGQTMAASAALRVLDGNLSMRSAAAFLSSIQGVGAAMQFAFPVFGAIALIGILDKIPGAIHNGILMLEGWTSASKKAFEKSTEDADKWATHLIDLNARIANIGLIGISGSQKSGMQGQLAGAEGDAVTALLVKTQDRINAANQTIRDAKATAVQGTYVPGQMAPTQVVRTHPEISPADVERAKIQLETGEKQKQDLLGRLEDLSVKGMEDSAQSKAASAADAKANQDYLRGLGRTSGESYRKAIAGDESSPMRNLDTSLARIRTDRATALREHPGNAQQINNAFLQQVEAAGIAFRHEIEKSADKVTAEGDALNTVLARKARTADADYDFSGLGLAGPSIASAPAGYQSPAEALRNARRLGESGIRQARGRGPAGVESGQTNAAGLEYLAQLDKNERDLATFKITAAQKELADADALATKKEKVYEAEQQRLDAIQATIDQQKASFQSLAVGFLGAARSGGIQKFMMSQVNKLEDTAVSNLAGAAWGDPSKTGTAGGISAQLAKVIPKGGPLDKIFGLGVGAGAPKPEVVATNANTTATIANTQALLALRAAAISPSGGGGGMPSTAGIAASADGLAGADAIGGGVGMPANDPNAWMRSSGTGMSALSKGIGVAGSVVAGGFGVYSGIRSGGARGAMTATGSTLAAAGSIISLLDPVLKMAGPIGMAAGAALGIVTTIMGDPHAIRTAQIARTLETNQYRAPVSINASMTAGGAYSDYDRFGGARGSQLSPYPTIEQGFYDSKRNVNVPGRTDSMFGGGAAPIVVNVQTLDSNSFNQNSHLVASALVHALTTGKATGLQETLRAM